MSNGKTILLGQVPDGDVRIFYRVKKLVNDTRFRIGEKLTADQVDSLCSLPNWTVTIVDGTK